MGSTRATEREGPPGLGELFREELARCTPSPYVPGCTLTGQCGMKRYLTAVASERQRASDFVEPKATQWDRAEH